MASDNIPARRLMAKLTDHLERRHGGAGVSELVLELAASRRHAAGVLARVICS
jgi:hypothetical protein